MRRLMVAATALGFFAAVAPAMAVDAVKADPAHYKIEVDNAQVRVLRAHFGPHEKSVMHSHPDTIAVFLTDGHVKFTAPDGKTQEANVKAGETQWRPAETHLPENLGDTPFDVIVVELKHKAPPPAHKMK